MTKYKIELFVTDGSIFGKDWARHNEVIESDLNSKGIRNRLQKVIDDELNKIERENGSLSREKRK